MKSKILKVLLFFLFPTIFVSAEEDKTRILFGEIKSNIDPRTNRYSKLLIEEANNDNYDLVIIEM